MIIEKKIRNYLVFSGDKLIEALRRINDNQARIVFVVQDNGLLLGAISDGDFRRWITGVSNFDLNQPVDSIMNTEVLSAPVDAKPESIGQLFSHKIDLIPLVDSSGRFVALARQQMQGLQIGKFKISEQDKTFIIAEVGNNHNGDIALAKRYVDLALDAGADCVKFQMRDLTQLYSNKGKTAECKYDLGSQYTLDLLNKFQLSKDELLEVFDYSYQRGILPLCTPWDMPSLQALEEYGVEAFKVASADFTNHEMLETLAGLGKPLLCSTGMCTESEIKSSVNFLRRLGAQFAVLHCNSTYPTPFRDVNLNYLPRLKEISGTVVGYSGHERGFSVPVAAVAMGARVVEKHLTVDRTMEGNDHKVSLLPDEFADMVRHIREVEEAMGQSQERVLTQGEMINRENLAKSLVINQDLPAGEIITREMIEIKSPGQGLQPNRLEELVGRTAQRNFNKGDFFFETDITGQYIRKSHYTFSRPYGIPVRYHDYAQLCNGVNLDFVEFHLSYHDMDIELSQFFNGPQEIGFAVHCPELFAGDHILDLATDDSSYLEHSLNELRRVVQICSDLTKFFPKTQKPVLVVNAGGWKHTGFVPQSKRAELYKRVINSLEQVDLNPVVLAIQTMPPFPWHFGGQSYHNIFMDPDEIAVFCENTGHSICLDVSHSMMACNYYNWDFSSFLEKVLPFTIHLHIVDALGLDGEGVQIGNGDVDFNMLARLLREQAPNVQFISEIWQGHKNKGEGFWHALDFLERLRI
jgi:sialic acid synthase SpsE/sugar phosphate isomerase/epimerase